MDWFLFDSDLRHERLSQKGFINYIWQRPKYASVTFVMEDGNIKFEDR